MIEERYLLTSVPEKYRRAYYSYLFENEGLNSEHTMSGPEWMKFRGFEQQQQEGDE
jgi:hypothetical protein